jgi:hypothetical protein
MFNPSYVMQLMNLSSHDPDPNSHTRMPGSGSEFHVRGAAKLLLARLPAYRNMFENRPNDVAMSKNPVTSSVDPHRFQCGSGFSN